MKPSIEIELKETRPMTVAFVTMEGLYAQIPDAFGKLYGWIVENGYTPCGPAMAVYHSVQVPEDQALWELRSQIVEDVPAREPEERGSVGMKKVEAMWVAAAMHKGPYEDVEEDYRVLMNWAEENGCAITGPYEELYFNDPTETPVEELMTEIRFPVCKK